MMQIPLDVLARIIWYSDNPQGTSQICKHLQKAAQKTFAMLFREYQQSKPLERFVQQVILDIPAQSQQVTSILQADYTCFKRMKEVYRRVLDEALKIGGHQMQIAPIDTGEILTLSQLERLVHWSEIGQARSLTAFFKFFSTNHPTPRELDNRLIAYQRPNDILVIAEQITQWLSKHKDYLHTLTSISKNNIPNLSLTTLPEQIGLFTDLLILNLNCCGLIHIGDAIGKLVNMRQFYACNNKIASISSEMGKLIKLQELYLSSNQLKNLPASFVNLNALERLLLDGNRFEEFPTAIVNLSSLQMVNLSKNQLSSISASLSGLQSLEYFHLEDNHLRSLPNEIGALSLMRNLNLKGNPLESLPMELQNLPMLNEINIDPELARLVPTTMLWTVNLFHRDLNSEMILRISAAKTPEETRRLRDEIMALAPQPLMAQTLTQTQSPIEMLPRVQEVTTLRNEPHARDVVVPLAMQPLMAPMAMAEPRVHVHEAIDPPVLDHPREQGSVSLSHSLSQSIVHWRNSSSNNNALQMFKRAVSELLFGTLIVLSLMEGILSGTLGLLALGAYKMFPEDSRYKQWLESICRASLKVCLSSLRTTALSIKRLVQNIYMQQLD